MLAIWTTCNFVIARVMHDDHFKMFMKYEAAGDGETATMWKSYLCVAMAVICFTIAAFTGYWFSAVFIAAYVITEIMLANRVKRYYDGA